MSEPERRVHPLLGAFVSVALFGGVLVAGVLAAHGASDDPAESVRAFTDFDCASPAPRVDVRLANATIPSGAGVNASVTIANPGTDPVALRLDAVTVSVHALTTSGSLRPVVSATGIVDRPVVLAADHVTLRPGALVPLEDLGAPAVSWNGTDASGAALNPGMHVLAVHLNAVPGAACEDRVIGYQVFEIAAARSAVADSTH